MALPLIGAAVGAAARMAAKKAPTKKAQEEARKEAQEEVREKAMKEAKAETKDGVKTTEYPYIEPGKAIRNIQERNPVRAGSGPRLVDEIIEKMEYKKGGSVSPSKKVLAKSGFYDKGTTKSEREKIVSKVTTKPQRVKMVEKMLSTKKMKSGGSASTRADGIAIRGKTKGRTV